MGHREALLIGAKRCLYERGYANTTARDIVQASGTNLASIGYHFGSKEALLNAAMIAALEEWSDEVGRALAEESEHSGSFIERFEAIWTRILASFATHRQLWVATFEIMAQAEHLPEVRAFLSDAVEQGRQGLAALFHDIEENDDERRARTVGAFYQALLSGVFVQWLIDPGRAPTSGDLTEAVRIVIASAATSPGTRSEKVEPNAPL